VKSLLLRWLTLFTGLFVLTVPFPYQLLPSPGDYLAPLFTPLHRWLAESVFRVPAPYTLAVRSDSTGLYLHALVLLGLATLGAGLWVWRWPQRPRADKLAYWLHAGASYYLALQLLAYGFDKVFKHQFYLPEPNTLYTPLGQLTPDILYWSTMGASRPYTVLAGLAEVVPALLLLFRRTRALGGLLALGVLLNVAALNLGFDISVKLYSLFLLLLSLVAAGPALCLLYRALLRRQAMPPAPPGPRFGPWQPVLKAALIGLLLLETAGPFVQTGHYNDDTAPRPLLHGAYQVERFVVNGDSLSAAAGRLTRLFVHRQGYFITQTADAQLQDYPLSYGPGRLHLRGYDGTRITLRYRTAGPRLLLRGRWGPDSVFIEARTLPWRRLPLLQPEFHWTTDSYR
jgi:uncharacterized membrane protein YhaH (DUF805 family)